MNQPSDIHRLANALSAYATTLTEIITEKLREHAISEQQRIAMQATEPWLNKKQVVELMNVSLRSIDNWVRKRRLPYFKIGRMVRFRMSDIEKSFAANFRVGGITGG